ncbi:hypothetical protein PMZ80_002107 [Knufia obscura]|uniref:Glycosyltransferase family 31 protein n=2 Tax=Knufia TaxID=430999 RepID=A0AAN8EM08_9EURO|nr:hypothetical protein PMZ80_002107 [Knufia obscura]KAK5953922.1 hypothetical protein OHC33_005193 [Knufia fluminis]
MVMPFRPSQLAAGAIFACLLLWYTLGTGNKPDPTPANVQPPAVKLDPTDEVPFYDIPANGHFLGHNGIINLTNPQIQMAKVHIAVSQSDMQPLPLMQSLDIKLPASTEITITDELSDPNVKHPETARTVVNIPRVPRAQVDASEFIFGVATTYERLEESLDTMSHWLGGSNARIIGHMEPSLDADAPDRVLKKARDLSISLGTVDSRYEFLDRYFALLKVLQENKLPSTKWYVFIDDDTFFLDMSKLLTTFAKYDPAEPWYIGTLSEDFQQMANWGYMAYGGGGIFLSAPLVEQILPHWDQCFAVRNTGDKMLAQCIYHHTTTKFTWEQNLHQVDLHGDQSGFYEALRQQPLSLHHWKSGMFRSTIDMYNLSRVASVCGNSCLLQKFRFKNNWVLTNGFSLVKYSDIDMRHRKIDTDISMERTWDFHYGGSTNAHFEHSLGPIRKPDEGGKISFRMESAITEQDGRVRQLYVKRQKTGDDSHGVVEAVVEVEWSLA